MPTDTAAVLTLDRAERLVQEVQGRINEPLYDDPCARYETDRAQLISDLDGLRKHSQTSEVGLAPGDWCPCGEDEPCPDAERYSAGLRRTAALYGVTP